MAWRVSSPSAETLLKTARTSTKAGCVLDANVLLAWIDAADSLHTRAHDLLNQLEQDGSEPASLDANTNGRRTDAYAPSRLLAASTSRRT